MTSKEIFDIILQLSTLLISIAGFWLLYTTFALQARVTEDQQEIKRIEQQSFKISIRPRFKKYYGGKATWDEAYFNTVDPQFQFGVKLKDNTAISVSVVNDYGNLKHLINEFKALSVQLNEIILFIYGVATPNDFNEKIRVSIFYQDEMGNRYCQMLHGKIKSLQLSPPLISESPQYDHLFMPKTSFITS